VGKQDISEDSGGERSASFREALLGDLNALEQMLQAGALESDVVRIGAEQEMFLIDRAYRPAPIASQVLERLSDSRFTTEIGKFNLEANVPPRIFSGTCLRSLEAELNEMVQRVSAAAQACEADVLLSGILPSIRLPDLGLTNLTDKPRYHELNRAVMKLRGDFYHLLIKGIDELQLVHDSVMPEACCTSFQVHLQLNPRNFDREYNASLLIAAPVLAAAVNSPILLGRRLWQETRIALFQHAVDERSHSHIARRHPTRVSFGEGWIRSSVLEIYREQVARFRSIMTGLAGEDSVEALAEGRVPGLGALVLHNSTVWRWNRPCFGITEGKPHLRLEFRALPAGPTVLDEVANATFFFGLMRSIPQAFGDIPGKMPFDDVKDNFFAAARHGLKAQVTWLDGKHHAVDKLISEQLISLANAGLRDSGIEADDIEKYLGIIRERVEADQTGSRWILSAAASMPAGTGSEYRDRRIVGAMLLRQKSGEPVHRWSSLARDELESIGELHGAVSEMMSTDLFTVTPDDPITLAASMMDWRHIRHLPVEDAGRFLGLISSREILHFMADPHPREHPGSPVRVRELMNPHPVTIQPDNSIEDALKVMLENELDCLPVVDSGLLVGIVTSRDMLQKFSLLLKLHQRQVPELYLG